MKTLIAFDPGNTTGWAIFTYEEDTKNAKLVKWGQAKFDDMYTLFNELPKPDTIIYEDFMLRSSKAKSFGGSRFEVVQIIGMIKKWQRDVDCKNIVQQPASIKHTAQKFSGVTPVGGHANSHWIDAYNHGFFWLVKNNWIRTVLQQKEDDKK